MPTAPAAPAFKESAVVPPPDLPGGGWKQVTPNDSTIRANWWEIYQDPQLDKLEQQVAVSNQTLKASYEQYMQARAAIQVFAAESLAGTGLIAMPLSSDRFGLSSVGPLRAGLWRYLPFA